MASGTPASRRRTRAAAGIVAAGLAALLTAATGPVAAAAPDSPGVDEIDKSRDMRHLANLPKQPPFDIESAYGTDIAFQGRYAIAGNYEGFTIYDIRNPRRPAVVSQVSCPGGQNDVSISGDLLFLSNDYARSDDSCQSTSVEETDPNNWQGIKVFDISNKRSPRYVAAVPTACGSHTHTLVPSQNGRDVYIYVSSYGPMDSQPKCQPPHDRISIVEVSRDNPAEAAVVAEPVLFPDGGNPGDDQEYPEGTRATSGCHDLTSYPEKAIMAGACMGDGVLFDISDPLHPRTIDIVQDNENFAFWHSATFNNRADKIVFTDELGGGVRATCNATIGDVRGANGIYDVVGRGDNRRLVFRSYYKIPRHQTDTENCVAHNGSLIPVKGRDIMAQAWYQGGVSVWDFTNSRRPKEIAFFERGPLSTTESILGGAWSAYYYNGYIYSSDIQKGLDVLDVRDPRTRSGKRWRWDEFNAQTQESYGRAG